MINKILRTIIGLVILTPIWVVWIFVITGKLVVTLVNFILSGELEIDSDPRVLSPYKFIKDVWEF